MAYTVRNIIVGAAAVYVSVLDSTSGSWNGGPALPTAVTLTQFSATLEAATATWKGIGFTSDGLELSYEPDYGDVEVDQLLDAARLFKQSMKVTLATSLTEATLDNLLVAWANKSSLLASTVSDATLGIAAGSLGDEPVERALVAVGPAPKTAAGNKRERIYHCRRVLSVDTTAIALKRNEATVFPVSFRLLPDTNFTDAEYGIIRDRNYT